MSFIYLFGAIISEVFGSTMMKMTAMTKSKLSVLGIVVGYGISFYLLSLSLTIFPLSFAYAVWSGLGTALTAIAGYLVFKETLNMQMIFGIVLLIVGIVLMRL